MNVKRCKPQQRIGVPCCRYRRNTPDSTTLLAPCIYNTRIISTYTDVVKVKKAVVCQILRHTAAFFRSHIRRGQAKMTLSNTTETYSNLQPFFTIDELNANTTAIRERHGKDLTRSTYRVLDVLHRYSCTYYGVSFRSKSKIAKELGISRKTVTRACQHLESIGVIKQHELKRHNGDRRRSSNAIVFVPVKPMKKENVPTECPSVETPLDSTKPKQSLHDTYASQPSLFNRFKSILANSTGDQSIASRLFGIYRSQSIKLQRFEHLKNEQETFDSLAIQALQITTQATKRKKIKSITGYYDGVLRELIGKALFSDSFMKFDVEPDFKMCTH